MKEGVFYNIENGQRGISAYYDGTTDWLEINEEVIAITTQGTAQYLCDEYLIRTNNFDNTINEILDNINFDFYSDKHFYTEHSSDFQGFLSYFRTGRYYIISLFDSYIHFVEKDYKVAIFKEENYWKLVQCIKSRKGLSEKIISKYLNEINRGLRPIVIGYKCDYDGEDGMIYLLDGHHKIVAYERAGEPPNFQIIIEVRKDEYNYLNPAVYSYLNHKDIIEKLEFHYQVHKDENGNIKKLISPYK